MVKTVTRFFILTLSNYLTLNLSKDVDVDQLVKDIESISLNVNITYESLYLSVSILISLISIFLIYFFQNSKRLDGFWPRVKKNLMFFC